MNTKVIVSVSVVTYNHIDYIKQCLDGILMQQTTFPFEVILGEDESTDGTREICKEYANKHPDKIKLFLRSRKDVIYINGNATGRYNFIENLKAAKGKYIALCEGDDYWTDPLKLQKQVDFLEINNEYGGIATNSEVVYNDSESKSHLFSIRKEKSFNLNDLLESRPFHTATFLFKRKDFKKDFPVNVLSADRTLFMLVACFGKIKYLQDITAVYRKNATGISSKVTSKQMRKDFNISPYISKYSKSLKKNKLNAFVSYTVFAYSHKIYLRDYIKYSLYLVYYNFFKRYGIKNKLKSIKESLRLINDNYLKLSVINNDKK